MNKIELLKRYLFFLAGLFILALGVAISTKADLGTSPVSSVPFVLSLACPLSMGTITFLMHILFILLQILLLRSDYQKIQLLQLAVAVVFGVFTDLTLFLVAWLDPETYAVKWLCIIISCIISALGVTMEVLAGVLVLAGEGVILAISQVTHIEFGKVKIGFDVTQVCLAVTASFLLFHKLNGVREGTLCAAIVIGLLVRLFSKKLAFIEDWFKK